jgi:hypothetical protein
MAELVAWQGECAALSFLPVAANDIGQIGEQRFNAVFGQG